MVPLVEGRLYQLPNPYELNGRVTSHPATARGWAPSNSYLLLENSRALLVDAGYSVHEQSLLAQLGSLIDADTPVDFLPTAIGEFGSICNVRPITERFNVVRYYGILDDANRWLDFRPDHTRFGDEVGGGRMATVENVAPANPDLLDWAVGTRPFEVFLPPLFLLPFKWGYDAETGTLFTGDTYNHVWRETAEGPWTVQPGEKPPPLDEVYDFLVGTRWWWLPGAATEGIEAGLAELFARLDVRMIAPRFGCAVTEPEAVAAHFELLQLVLRRARGR